MGQIAAIIQRKAADANARLRAMSGKPLEALSRKFTRIENLAQTVKRIQRTVGERLTPTIRQMVTANFAASGLGSPGGDTRDGYTHGDLKRGVAAANVIVGLNGIYIRMGQGMNAKVYAVAGALQYGAIRGSSKEGRARSAQKKRGLERAAGNQQRKVGGQTVIEAHPFFQITAAQVSQLESKYAQLFQEEIDRALAG